MCSLSPTIFELGTDPIGRPPDKLLAGLVGCKYKGETPRPRGNYRDRVGWRGNPWIFTGRAGLSFARCQVAVARRRSKCERRISTMRFGVLPSALVPTRPTGKGRQPQSPFKWLKRGVLYLGHPLPVCWRYPKCCFRGSVSPDLVSLMPLR